MLKQRRYSTYYGEYSLKNWIKMILTKEIVLPKYQRYFVWNPENAIQLMDSLIKGHFIPPIVIASHREEKNENPCNLILDGQQRLSSILLCYLGYWPKKFITQLEDFANENSIDENGKDLTLQEKLEGNELKEVPKVLQEWTFQKIQYEYENIEQKSLKLLKKSLSTNENYQKIDDYLIEHKNKELLKLYSELSLNEDIFRECFLGFSFIKGNNTSSDEEKKVFSKIFRKINISGTPLTPAESREAFYWLNPKRKDFLSPDFAKNIKINNKRLDWVRTLAFVSESARIYKDKNNNLPTELRIAVGFGNDLESYFELFAQSIVDNDNKSAYFLSYKEDYLMRLSEVESTLKTLRPDGAFPSLLDADFYIWGLVFWIVFQGKSFDMAQLAKLNRLIKEAILPLKTNKEMKDINRLGKIRYRMKRSIEIYQRVMV